MLDPKRQVAIVVHPFAGFVRGDVITDPVELATLRQSGQNSFVVYTQIPGPAASEPDAEEKR